jgi:hypothetical protein
MNKREIVEFTKRTQQVIENTENQPPCDVYFGRTQAGRTLVSDPALEKLNFAVRAHKIVRCTPRLDPARSAGRRPTSPYQLVQENNLGSIQPGKLADLVVLDRDYLSIPAEQIKDIKPMLTIVGGRIVYDAALLPAAAR